MKPTISLLLVLVLAGCSGSNKNISQVKSLEMPNARISDPTFFNNERTLVDARNNVSGIGKTPITGLALSGGGIRSNAFQLGFLSGLANQDRLKKIQYLSAVSGGSWAAGAYKIHDEVPGDINDSLFFRELEVEIYSYDPDTASKDDTTVFLSDYEISEKLADIGLIPTLNPFKKLDKKVGATARDKWQRMIKENFLRGKDAQFCEIEKKHPNKPILIVNASHDAVFFIPGTGTDNAEISFPFEFSANFIGTIADCGNTDYCGMFRHLANWRYKGAYVTPDSCNIHIEPLTLSKALAASGAVTPRKILGHELNLLDWRVSLHDPFENIKDPASPGTPPRPPSPDNDNWKYEFRYMYDLTDGGQSDNLGILPLLERRVDRIIVTDEAYDPDYSFGDLEAVSSHAERLLGVTVTLEGKKLYSVDAINSLSSKVHDPHHIFVGAYSSSYGNGQIIYIKPNLNIDGFMRHLRIGGFCGGNPDCQQYTKSLYAYLFDNRKEITFPFDKTMEGSYDRRVIHAFYFLGRYMAEVEYPKYDP
jgi:patatin-like phospholipase